MSFLPHIIIGGYEVDADEFFNVPGLMRIGPGPRDWSGMCACVYVCVKGGLAGMGGYDGPSSKMQRRAGSGGRSVPQERDTTAQRGGLPGGSTNETELDRRVHDGSTADTC